MTKVANVGGLVPAALYAPDCFQLEDAVAQEGSLLS
jgi:hypothetical protein